MDDAARRAVHQQVGPPKPYVSGVTPKSPQHGWVGPTRDMDLSQPLKNALSDVYNRIPGKPYGNNTYPSIPGGRWPGEAWDVEFHDFTGIGRGPGRIVRGSDNSWWFSPDHFTEMWYRLL